jgi:hypothetical protein
MHKLSIAIAGAIAASVFFMAPVQKAAAQAELWNYCEGKWATLGYCQRNPGCCSRPGGYRGERERANQRYGTYWDYCGNRPATLGYCQRNPGCCN